MLFNATQSVIFAMAVLENNRNQCIRKMEPWRGNIWWTERRRGGGGAVWWEKSEETCVKRRHWIWPDHANTQGGKRENGRSPEEHRWGQHGCRKWEEGRTLWGDLERPHLGVLSCYLESIKYQENMPRSRKHSFTLFSLLTSIQINVLGAEVRNEVNLNWEQKTYTLFSKLKW